MDPEQNPECNGLKKEWEVRKSMEWGWNSFRDSYFVFPRPKAQCGDFPGGPVVKNPLAMQGTKVQSLVEELRSHVLWSN